MCEFMNFKRLVFFTLLVTAFFTVYYRDLLFGPAIFETGDYAANALKIINAKSLSELYGNYSRWSFNHPGPAFFYCYALGEIFLYDTLKIFNSPHQSHVFMGLLIQSFFIGLTFLTLYHHSRSWLFANLLFLIFFLHFRYASFALIDIWPPNVLVGPLIALIICAAAFSSGHISYLPYMILSSCFLIHGHVAQPLFVLPIVGLSTGMYLWKRQTLQLDTPERTQLKISALFILIFSLPIMIDILKGSSSNLNAIIQHLKTHDGGSKTLTQSLGYLFTYFLYIYNTGDEVYINSRFNFLNFLKEYYTMLLSWVAVIILPIVFFIKEKTSKLLGSIDSKYFINLLIFCCLTLLLTIQWGRMLDGPFYAFNSHFNYGLVFLLLIPLILIIAKSVEVILTKYANIFLALSVIALICTAIFVQPPPTDSQYESDLFIPKHVHSRLDNSLAKPVFLLFDDSVWPKAAGVALALKREGVPYLVIDRWGYPFGLENIIYSNYSSIDANVWYISTVNNNTVHINSITNSN